MRDGVGDVGGGLLKGITGDAPSDEGAAEKAAEEEEEEDEEDEEVDVDVGGRRREVFLRCPYPVPQSRHSLRLRPCSHTDVPPQGGPVGVRGRSTGVRG